MADTAENRISAAELRRKAEEKVAAQQSSTAELDAKRLLHELQVHQAELEMQNEELHHALRELSEHKIHLENIIKNTPAGYFHIDLEGRFLEVNNDAIAKTLYATRGVKVPILSFSGNSQAAF